MPKRETKNARAARELFERRSAAAKRGVQTRERNARAADAARERRAASARLGHERRSDKRDAARLIADAHAANERAIAVEILARRAVAEAREARKVAKAFDKLGDVPTYKQRTKNGFKKPKIDYMQDLADELDIDVSDLYDMYYGYPPKGKG